LWAPAPHTKHQVEGRLLLDVVVLESAAILELLASEDETLLVRGDSLLVLDLGLNGLNSVSALHLEGDGLPRQGFDEDLHLQSTSCSQHCTQDVSNIDAVGVEQLSF